MECDGCSYTVPANMRECPSCGEDCGFPNVRLAQHPDEVAALNERVKQAFISAEAKGSSERLESFGNAIKDSKAIICRPLSDVSHIVSNENNSYASFQRQVQAGARIPLENEFDRVRNRYEDALYPHFSEKIIFGALSLDVNGVFSYGGCAMVMKEKLISKRTSLFEENPHTFVVKHKIGMTKPIPPGYRSDWERKDLLATAKLHSKITKTTKNEDFASALQNDTGNTGSSDFIEIHIYGTINRDAIEVVSCKLPKTKADRLSWAALGEQLATIGATARTI